MNWRFRRKSSQVVCIYFSQQVIESSQETHWKLSASISCHKVIESSLQSQWRSWKSVQCCLSHFTKTRRNRNSIFLSPTNPEEILRVVDSFSETKLAGPHSIPVRILKLLKLDIASPIFTLINKSFEMGIFPTLLKTSKVIPIFKNKGSPMNVSNYRPISLLSNIERIYEKVMYSRLIAFLDSHNLIYARQFGFRKGPCSYWHHRAY